MSQTRITDTGSNVKAFFHTKKYRDLWISFLERYILIKVWRWKILSHRWKFCYFKQVTIFFYFSYEFGVHLLFSIWSHVTSLLGSFRPIEFFMVTHSAIPSGGVRVWMINASIMESMDCSDQNTEPKMFRSTKISYWDFCCVPGCSNQREWQN